MRGDDELGWREWLSRPGLMLGYAALGAALVIVALGWTIAELGPARAMERAPVCASEATCLVPHTLGEMASHPKRKSFGREWEERTAAFPDPDAWVDVSMLGSRHLDADLRAGPVTGLSWHGHLVAFEGVDGLRVESADYGDRAWVFPLTIALGATAGVNMVVMKALVKRRRTGSWWKVTRSADLPVDAWTLVVAVAFFWACATAISLDIGASVARAEVINVVVFGAGVVVSIARIQARRSHTNALASRARGGRLR